MNWFKRLRTWFRLLRYRWSAEPAEMRYLLGRHFSGGSVLDIGRTAASIAIGCISTSATGTRVVAFEPQPELAEFLVEFKQSFHLDRMQVAAVGLSSQSGSLRMHRPRTNWDSATVDEFCYDDDNTEVFDVPVTTIDEYLDAHPELRPVRFIKVTSNLTRPKCWRVRNSHYVRIGRRFWWNGRRRGKPIAIGCIGWRSGWGMRSFSSSTGSWRLCVGRATQPAVVGVGGELCECCRAGSRRRWA